jgi:hypothetical protein
MFLVMADRNALVALVPKGAIWAEIGVYKGDFSQIVVDTCAPSKYYLIDNWKFDVTEQNPLEQTTDNFANFSGRVHWQHYGDDGNLHQEENYQNVLRRFSSVPAVSVIRARSVEGIRSLPDGGLDVMYIDANHQYEYVLRDLAEARGKVKPGGLIFMNDFYEGPGGFEQNLGVMAAVNTFLKRNDYIYLAMTSTAFGDVVITDDPAAAFARAFLNNLKDSETQFVGISDVLVPNLRHKLYRKSNGETRIVPML